ncbi:MAG TPA: hypothetical protein VM101_02795 [Flavitalea sp.]|nr:hypothetical protein [Flavitalea sp.]
MSLITESNAGDITPQDKHAAPVRWFAHAVSFIFHPLFIPLYVTLFVLYVHPLLFAGYSDLMKIRLTATIFVNLVLLPAVTVFLCWRLKFISSIFLNTQKERIIPLAAAMIFYFWCWFVLKSNGGLPVAFRQFLQGTFITIIGAWLANIAFKVSLHALAAGGLFCFMLLLMFNTEGGSAQYFAAVIAVAGLICSSRLIVSSHKHFDVYAGFIIGVVSQLLGLLL